MKWNDLTMKERSDLMSLFLKAGVGSLSDMKRIYDEGGHLFGGKSNTRGRSSSLGMRAINWITDRLGLTDAPTYTDGYGTIRNQDVSLAESAQGQELKRMAETAKDAVGTALTGFSFMNPVTTSTTLAGLAATLGQAYGLSLGAKNVYDTTKKAISNPSSVSIPEYIFAGMDALSFLPSGRVSKQAAKDLFYELHPKYQRFYHATEKPFDIDHFHTGTLFDSGLHVSHDAPIENMGSTVYKGYMEKPTFRFLDRGRNGIEIADYNYTIPYDYMSMDVGQDKFSRLVYDQMFHGKAPYKQTGKQLTIEGKPYLSSISNEPIDLLEKSFPSLKAEDKARVRQLVDRNKELRESVRAYISPLDYPEEIKKELIDINTEFSSILAKNGYRTGVYGNANSMETVKDSYAIFTPEAIKNTRLYNNEPLIKISFPSMYPFTALSALHNTVEDISDKHSFGGLIHKYPDGGELKPATITEKIGKKWDNLYWQKFREPRDYSDEVANTPECAQWSNAQLRKMGYNIWGDAWTRSNQRVKKVFSGYDGMTKPDEYTYKGYRDYVLGAADNVKKNFNWRDLQEGDIVGMYFRGSPNYQKAFLNGANGEAQTHTGHIVYRKGKPYVAHNVHGDIKLNKAKKVTGRKHPYGIVSVYRPYGYGGHLTF